MLIVYVGLPILTAWCTTAIVIIWRKFYRGKTN